MSGIFSVFIILWAAVLFGSEALEFRRNQKLVRQLEAEQAKGRREARERRKWQDENPGRVYGRLYGADLEEANRKARQREVEAHQAALVISASENEVTLDCRVIESAHELGIKPDELFLSPR